MRNALRVQLRAALPVSGEYTGQLVALSTTGAVYSWDGAAWVDLAAGGGGPLRRVVGVTFDGNGSPPTVGSIGYAVVPFTGTIDQWTIIGDASGSAVVDVWKAAGTIPTNGDTIAGSEKPTLTAAQIASDTSLTTWTTAVTAGDVFGFELESASTLTWVTVSVRITE